MTFQLEYVAAFCFSLFKDTIHNSKCTVQALTYGGCRGHGCEDGVGEHPRLLARVGVDSGLDGLVQLLLEGGQAPPREAVPRGLVEVARGRPQRGQEVAVHATNAWATEQTLFVWERPCITCRWRSD